MTEIEDLFQDPFSILADHPYEIPLHHPKLLVHALVLSDTHFGTGRTNGTDLYACTEHFLLDYLRLLVFAGDTWDLWKIRAYEPETFGRVFRSALYSEDEQRFMNKVLKISNKISKKNRVRENRDPWIVRMGLEPVRTKIVIAPGNHDEYLRNVDCMTYGNITVCSDPVLSAPNGKRYLILHGDIFDPEIQKGWKAMRNRLVTRLGTFASHAALRLDRVAEKTGAAKLCRSVFGEDIPSFSVRVERRYLRADIESINDAEFEGAAAHHLFDQMRREKLTGKRLPLAGIFLGHSHKSKHLRIDLPKDLRPARDVPQTVDLINSGHWTNSPSLEAQAWRMSNHPYTPNTGILVPMDGDPMLFRYVRGAGIEVFNPQTKDWTFPYDLIPNEPERDRYRAWRENQTRLSKPEAIQPWQP